TRFGPSEIARVAQGAQIPFATEPAGPDEMRSDLRRDGLAGFHRSGRRSFSGCPAGCKAPAQGMAERPIRGTGINRYIAVACRPAGTACHFAFRPADRVAAWLSVGRCSLPYGSRYSTPL